MSTYSPWPNPVWWPSHQVSTASPLYSWTPKLNASFSSSPCSGWNHTGSPPSLTMRGASWLGPLARGSFFGATKKEPGAVPCDRLFTSTAGGRNSGRERNAHGSSPRAGEATALARGLRLQPKVPPSTIHPPPAAAAARNLRRVIFAPKLSTLHRSCVR